MRGKGSKAFGLLLNFSLGIFWDLSPVVSQHKSRAGTWARC